MLQFLMRAYRSSAPLAPGDGELHTPDPPADLRFFIFDGAGGADFSAGQASDAGGKILLRQRHFNQLVHTPPGGADSRCADDLAYPHTPAAEDAFVSLLADYETGFSDAVDPGHIPNFLRFRAARHQQVEDYRPGAANLL